jgi:hypothetical protein
VYFDEFTCVEKSVKQCVKKEKGLLDLMNMT